MKVLLLGGSGQVGRALTGSKPQWAEVVAPERGILDISDAESVKEFVGREQPKIIINSAAYTDVDGAESNEERAYAINAGAVDNLATAAQGCGARFVQISTDYVFDGSRNTPYPPDAEPAPLNAYGRSKLAGEKASGPGALVVRTSWVYSQIGTNFVRTMLRLMSSQQRIGVVADQVGTPTYAAVLAAALWGLIDREAIGTHHYTNSGVASWYDFAVAIQEEATSIGLIGNATEIVPIATVDFPRPAARPPFSVLDKTQTFRLLGDPAPHWRASLREMLREIDHFG